MFASKSYCALFGFKHCHLSCTGFIFSILIGLTSFDFKYTNIILSNLVMRIDNGFAKMYLLGFPCFGKQGQKDRSNRSSN